MALGDAARTARRPWERNSLRAMVTGCFDALRRCYVAVTTMFAPRTALWRFQ